MNGIGGCPTSGRVHRLHDAGLPDKFMPFMNEPPGAAHPSAVLMHGASRCARPAARS